MDRARRRLFAYVSLIFGTVIVFTLLYTYGMSVFEGRPRSVLESFQVVVQTVTTTGYGEDAPWQSSQLLILVVLMQVSGILLIFLTLPLFVVPWVENRLAYRPSTAFDDEDHVVICGFTERAEALTDELETRDVGYVLLVADRDRARDLHESGYSVMVGDPESGDVLEAASIPAARAVVLDQDDEANANVALSIRELSETVRIVAFADDPELSTYLDLAGIDEVLLPRTLLGRSLADTVSSTLATELGDTVEIGGEVEIIELPLQTGCPLDEVTLAESDIRKITGVNILGAWIQGEFVPNLGPETELDCSMVLLVSGTRSQLEAVMDYTLASDSPQRKRVIIAGYGDVGQTVHEAMKTSVQTCTIIDREQKPGVDVVGDARNVETFEEADIDSAGAVIITIGTDADTVFSTLVARDLNPAVQIICRADEPERVSNLYAAGADYVLALATVAGRMLAESILGEEVLSYDMQIDIVRTTAPSLSGQTLAEAAIRERTGCTVIGVERNGEVHTNLGVSFELDPDDVLFVAGTDENIASFTEIYAAGNPLE